jgi:hypothetical protein
VSDAFKKVRPGDKLAIQATAWNRVIDQVTTKPRFDGNTSPWPLTNFRVRVRNNTSTGISRWCVLQVQGILEAPTGVGSQFEQWPGVVGYTPESGADPDLAYVVAVEPIPAGAIGQAAIDGVVQSRLLVRCTGHRYAKPKINEMDYLETAHAGPFRILWKAPTGPANPTGVTGPTKPWALLTFDYERPLEEISGHTTGAVQLLGHGKAATGASGCDTHLSWYTMTECSGNPSYAASYFL